MTTESNQIVPYPGPNGGMNRVQITNRLNMLHFLQDPLLVVVRHQKYGYAQTLKAIPEVSHGELLKAHWTKDQDLPANFHQFLLDKIIIPGVSTSLEFTTENIWLESQFLQVEIPEHLIPIGSRQATRLAADPSIEARLTQHGVSFQGTLADYSPQGMRLELQATGPQSFYWFNEGQDITMTLSRGNKVLYSGLVAVLRNEGDRDAWRNPA